MNRIGALGWGKGEGLRIAERNGATALLIYTKSRGPHIRSEIRSETRHGYTWAAAAPRVRSRPEGPVTAARRAARWQVPHRSRLPAGAGLEEGRAHGRAPSHQSSRES